MTLLEVTKMAINQENTKTELEALSERIDVMFLVGNKFEMDEYLELVDMVNEKITQLTPTDEPEHSGTGEDTGEGTGKDETGGTGDDESAT